ncbi:CPK1 [Symbiodinium natans]|uniref:CPK1 protein n=1 Tax=Symbiodinium natans TaxID=878477 RepID=A0A812NA15_9DINO|nr:CPK1 [Symbiodinium natans]
MFCTLLLHGSCCICDLSFKVTTVLIDQDATSAQRQPGKEMQHEENDEGESEEESEPSEEEASSSDEEEEDDTYEFESCLLHRFHGKSSPSQPVRIDRCGSAGKLAERAALDLKVRGDLTDFIRIRVAIRTKRGIMEIAGSTCAAKVQMFRSEVATTEVAAPLAMTIVVIVPEGPQGAEWCSRAERDRKAVNGVDGWVLVCPADSTRNVLEKIADAGGIRSGLQLQYHLFMQGKQGLGAFGFVVCASDSVSEKIVAVKSLKLQVDPLVIFNEVAMLRAAQGHPNIVRFRGLWADPTNAEQSKGGRQWYMVMDYFKGDLYDRIVEGRRLREKECVPILHSVLSSIAFLHKRQIFHRDIKPENLLIETAAKVVLTDFGIACLVTDESELKRKVGTVGYASPEMLAGTATGFEGDEFGAGIVLYFMLSKSTPFLAPTPAMTVEKTFQGKVNMAYQCFDHISESCRSMINGLVCKDVSARVRAHEALNTTFLATRASLTEPVLDCSVMMKPKGSNHSILFSIAEKSDKQGSTTQGNLPAMRNM